jgi:thiamine-phosphate pyrophosphorylase
MYIDKKQLLLYAVTDQTWTGEKSLITQVEEALKGGATCIQLREKELSDEEFIKEAFIIKELCQKYKVPFIINDNVEVAIQCQADGIHVGQKDMHALGVRKKIGPNMILGVSAQTVEQAVSAEKDGANYLGVGAVFTTSTKLDADAVSKETLKEICKSVTIPVIAIGGISKHNIVELSGTGIDGVALVSAIFAEKDIETATKELRILSYNMVNSKF